MALVPYTITAIERDVADAAITGKQVVVGAVCSMFLQPADTAVLMYDNADGDNGNTAKVTNSSGQVTVWVDAGDYRVSVNSNDSFISLQSGGVVPSDTVTETQTLIALQTTVTLASITTTRTAFYINGPSVDNGRLVFGVDYTLTSTVEIELATDYPAGTLITAVQNDGTEGESGGIRVFDNVAAMQAASVSIGDTALIKLPYGVDDEIEGAFYSIVAAGTGVADGVNFINLLTHQAQLLKKNSEVLGDNGRRYRVISAVIRNSGAGWFIINDAVHEPTGLQSVSVEPDGTIRLNHNVGASEVGTLVATPDETFAKQGLIVGSSVGNGISFLQIAAPLDFTVNTASGALTIPSYLLGDITSSVSAGQCTINHPTVTTNVPPVAVSVGSAAKTDFNVSFGPTQTVLDGVGDVDGYIRWDGASWLYSGTLRVPPTFSFSAGELTVAHPSADQFNLSLVGREDGLRVGAGSLDKTSFKVRFYDAAGAQVTTVSTLMKFYVCRRARATKDVIEGSVSVKSGYVPIDADKVISASGNIWIYGLMVV